MVHGDAKSFEAIIWSTWLNIGGREVGKKRVVEAEKLKELQSQASANAI